MRCILHTKKKNKKQSKKISNDVNLNRKANIVNLVSSIPVRRLDTVNNKV